MSPLAESTSSVVLQEEQTSTSTSLWGQDDGVAGLVVFLVSEESISVIALCTSVVLTPIIVSKRESSFWTTAKGKKTSSCFSSFLSPFVFLSLSFSLFLSSSFCDDDDPLSTVSVLAFLFLLEPTACFSLPLSLVLRRLVGIAERVFPCS